VLQHNEVGRFRNKFAAKDIAANKLDDDCTARGGAGAAATADAAAGALAGSVVGGVAGACACACGHIVTPTARQSVSTLEAPIGRVTEAHERNHNHLFLFVISIKRV